MNAKGGTFWIGIREKDDRAPEPQPVANVETERRRVEDALLDLLEPPPLFDVEVTIRIVPAAPDGDVLAILVSCGQAESRGPFAVVRGARREFPLRAGARTRSMTRQELEEAFRPGKTHRTDPGGRRAESPRLPHLDLDLDKAAGRGKPCLWLALVFQPHLALNLREQRWEGLLRDAQASGNRPEGWNFASRFHSPQIEGGHLLGGHGDELALRLYRKGALSLVADMEKFFHIGAPGEIYPYALLEHVTAVFRLAGAVYRASDRQWSVEDRQRIAEDRLRLADEHRPEPVKPKGMLLANVGMIAAQEWKLRPGTPIPPWWYHRSEVPPLCDERDLIRVQGPWEFPLDRLLENPDDPALDVVRWLYEEFGLAEEDIPREFDRKTRRLILD